MNHKKLETVNILPDVGILGLLPHLNYKMWYALAEFIDNALDSYLKHKTVLQEMEGMTYKLKVIIEVNSKENKIIIKDNAAGIDTQNYLRAFKAAQTPFNNKLLSEFGIGMKQAAFWFSRNWSVTTSALGESVERSIAFDLDKILTENLREVEVNEIPAKKENHYTIVTLHNIQNKIPTGSGLHAVKRHLASIYRDFIRDSSLELFWNEEPLKFDEVPILNTPVVNTNGDTIDDNIVEWKRIIDFELSDDLFVKGFIAIREKGSVSEAGIALFRRGRVIHGSFNETFRPASISGKSNSARFQRVFGELHLEGFDVSHTKDGFKWDENMEIFLDLLKSDLKSEPSLLRQADYYKAKEKKTETTAPKAKKPSGQPKEDDKKPSGQPKEDDKKPSSQPKEDDKKPSSQPKEDDRKPTVLEDKDRNSNPNSTVKPVISIASKNNLDSVPVQPSMPITPSEPLVKETIKVLDMETRNFEMREGTNVWYVKVELKHEAIVADWLTIKEASNNQVNNRLIEHHLKLQVAVNHPFMEKFVGNNPHTLEALLRIIISLSAAEQVVISSGGHYAQRVRENLNKFLKNF